MVKGVKEDVNPKNVLKHTLTSVGECERGESQTFQVKITLRFRGLECPKYLGQK
jgi:hypothetical protein